MEKQDQKFIYAPTNQQYYFGTNDETRRRRVAIYCWVSITEQNQLNSLSNQISELIRYLKSHKLFWGLEEVYVDIYSGTSEDRRPEFNRMLDDVRAGKIKTIVTKSIQRFGRNTKTVLKAIKIIHYAGASVIFVDENIDMRTRYSDLMRALLEGVAQEESQVKSENSR